MERKIITEEELIKLINERIQNSGSSWAEADGDVKEVKVISLSRWEKDDNGCNWDIGNVRGLSYSDEVRKALRLIIQEFMKQYNLEEISEGNKRAC